MSIESKRRRFIKHEALRIIRENFPKIAFASFAVFAVCFFPQLLCEGIVSLLESAGADGCGIISVFLAAAVFLPASPIIFGYVVFLAKTARKESGALGALIAFFGDKQSYIRALRFSVATFFKAVFGAASAFFAFYAANRLVNDAHFEDHVTESAGKTLYLALSALISLAPFLVSFFALLYSQSLAKSIYSFCLTGASASVREREMKRRSFNKTDSVGFDLSYIPLFLLSLFSFGILTVFFFIPYFVLGKTLYFTVSCASRGKTDDDAKNAFAA